VLFILKTGVYPHLFERVPAKKMKKMGPKSQKNRTSAAMEKMDPIKMKKMDHKSWKNNGFLKSEKNGLQNTWKIWPRL